MQEVSKKVSDHYGVPIEKICVWLDILSIPQAHDGLKKLAVDSLYAYAGLASCLVIIAPNSTHVQLQEPRDSLTYKKRVWTRAEQLAHYCQKGMKTMFLYTGGDLESINLNWIEEVSRVFEGEMTCCRRGHPDGVSCDKESLIPTLLGLYFDMYMKRKDNNENDSNGKSEEQLELVTGLIEKQKDRMFPEMFQYAREDGGVEMRTLFGDLIGRVDKLIEQDAEKVKIITSRFAEPTRSHGVERMQLAVPLKCPARFHKVHV